MMRASVRLSNGEMVYLLGLTTENLARLPHEFIEVDLAQLGGVGRVYLMTGESNEALARQFQDLIGPDTITNGLPKDS